MTKDEINAALREFVRAELSPQEQDRTLVTSVYGAVKDALGQANCLQIGSYPRYTAIRPLHDLDVLYVLGDWEDVPDNIQVLENVHQKVVDAFVNPTDFEMEISVQSHSIGICFKDGEEEVFAVDIVPAYADGVNEFDQYTYVVPEASSAYRSHGGDSEEWIKTDPRGYIQVASNLNDSNPDFRKAVKLVKFWRNTCKTENDEFPLKSFHIEQILSGYFSSQPDLTIFDAVFKIFCELDDHIVEPRIRDRADDERFIDEYIADITNEQRRLVLQARDHLMIELESITTYSDIREIFTVEYRVRKSSAEAYLFDSGIPVLTETTIAISGEVQTRTGGFRGFVLDIFGRIQVDRKIRFTPVASPDSDILKWKVKNDDDSPQPRGEITDHGTRNEFEHSKYIGKHYVECYAIKNNVCIAKARQVVNLGGD